MFIEYIRNCLANLNAYRFRTFLTLLAIVLGSFSIVLMSSLAESGLETVASGIEDLGGARLILLLPKQPEREKEKAHYSKGLDRDDLLLLQERLPHTIRVSGMKTLTGQSIRLRQSTKSHRTDIIGADELFLKTLDLTIESGRNFNTSDLEYNRRVLIVGVDLAQKLSGSNSPLDEEVTLFGSSYRIIAVLERANKMGVQIGFDWNDFAVIPETTFTERERLESPLEVLIVTTDKTKNNIVKGVLNFLIERRHKGIDDFQILDFNQVLKQFETIFAVTKLVVLFVAGIALFIGGVGIMNIMLVSINERIQEIGIRRAMGATRRTIVRQFVTEAALLTVTGGIIGVLLALSLKKLADVLIVFIEPSWVGVLSGEAVIYALLASILVGMIFGYFPARRASLLTIERCLRTERG